MGGALILPDDLHNRELIDEVHPPGWVNPTPNGRYNLVVVGGGTAGLVSAIGASGLGAKVALIERRLTGGDCLNFGCVPSKAILRAARVAKEVREAGAFGVKISGEVDIDFTAIMSRMRRLRAAISHNDSVHRLTKLGVEVYLGDARFVAADKIEVDGRTLSFSRAVIATGTRPASIPVPGLVGAGFLTNETIFSLTELPRRLIAIGAGPISCELAQAFRGFGSEVFLLTNGAGLLPKEDPEARALLTRKFEQEGIQLLLGAKLQRIERSSAKDVYFDRGNGLEHITADEILVAVGRTPNVEGLGLDAAGVDVGKSGVTVDDRLRTRNCRIFAAGDICSSYKFTHAADAMARVVLQNALFLGRKKMSSLIIPWCTYTDPEIAHVGLYEQEAKDKGHDVATYTVPLTEIDRAVLDGEEDGFARVHASRKNGRILGATLVAKHAGEMIGEMSLAITAGLRLADIGKTIHPYPTQSEAWKRIGDAYSRSRLTPRVQGIFQRWFSFLRGGRRA